MPPFVYITVKINLSNGLTFTGELRCEWDKWQKMRDRERNSWVEERMHTFFDFDWEETAEG